MGIYGCFSFTFPTKRHWMLSPRIVEGRAIPMLYRTVFNPCSSFLPPKQMGICGCFNNVSYSIIQQFNPSVWVFKLHQKAYS